MKIFKPIEISYDRYSRAVKTYLSKTFSDFGKQYNNSTVFGQIISVVESTVHNIILYIEDAFTEQNKFTATRKKSIYGLAALTGYNPSMGKAAGMQVKLSYIPTNSSQLGVIINNHERLVCGQNGMNYSVILPQDAIIMDITKDNTSKYLYIVEGTFESQTLVSNGGKLYTEHIDFLGDIDIDYLEVKVNNEVWERVESLYDMSADGKQWFYKTSLMGGIILSFGNDMYGRSLKNGDEITISYLRHSGEYGNINISEVAKFAFVNPLKNISGADVDGNSLFNISLATIDSVTSGTFPESQEQVKKMIGYNSRSMVLASPENYKVFLNRFSFVGYNRTWSEKGSLMINSIITRNYQSQLKDGLDYFNLKKSDFILSDNQKESIITYINNSGQQLAGVTYNILDPDIKRYAMYLYIKMKNTSYDVDYISNNIRKLIGEFFSNVEKDDYIPKSDIIQLIKANISEIDGVNCYFVSEENEQAIINKGYRHKTKTYNPSTGTYDIVEDYVYLYEGEDPGLGLDAHGNISIDTEDTYPVLMGGWSYISSDERQEKVTISDPLIITFE